MVDWKILIHGAVPSDWNPQKDGCHFPDEDTQDYLLPVFNLADAPIDPYGATEFDADALRRLKNHLTWNFNYVEAMPDSWTITETGGGRTKTMNLERAKVMAVVEKTLAMIDVAVATGGTIVFCGD